MLKSFARNLGRVLAWQQRYPMLLHNAHHFNRQVLLRLHFWIFVPLILFNSRALLQPATFTGGSSWPELVCKASRSGAAPLHHCAKLLANLQQANVRRQKAPAHSSDPMSADTEASEMTRGKCQLTQAFCSLHKPNVKRHLPAANSSKPMSTDIRVLHVARLKCQLTTGSRHTAPWQAHKFYPVRVIAQGDINFHKHSPLNISYYGTKNQNRSSS